MVKKRLFLRWTLLAALISVSAIICFQLGYFGKLRDFDASRLSFVIIGLFTIMSIYCGKLIWETDECLEKIHYFKLPEKTALEQLHRIENRSNHVWLAITYCQQLGLLGTLWGFLIIMIGGFQHLTVAEPQSIQKLLSGLGMGISTALLTTVVGLVCSMILALEHHLLINTIEEIKK